MNYMNKLATLKNINIIKLMEILKRYDENMKLVDLYEHKYGLEPCSCCFYNRINDGPTSLLEVIDCNRNYTGSIRVYKSINNDCNVFDSNDLDMVVSNLSKVIPSDDDYVYDDYVYF